MKNNVIVFLFLVVSVFRLSAQDDELNVLSTAMPILTIAPDSRAGAMGDAGAATSPDVYSIHWNAAKYAFMEKDFGFAFSYTPWMSSFVPDINLAKIVGYKKIDHRQAFAASLLYFSYGKIDMRNANGDPMGSFSPAEFTIDGAYTLKLSEKLSGAVTLRFLHSNLTGGHGSTGSRAANGVSSDISLYYNSDFEMLSEGSKIAFGMNISNLGTKISYNDSGENDFLPANLRIGSAVSFDIDDYNKMVFTLDLNKMLVPTPPIYDPIENDKIIAGHDPYVGILTGAIQSFYDAPGVLSADGTRNVFKEELRELMYGGGVEYWYSGQFAVRAGYYHEHASKGNLKYATVGAGLKLNVVGIDFAYLIPTTQHHPLENTVRFSLLFDFDAFDKKNDKE